MGNSADNAAPKVTDASIQRVRKMGFGSVYPLYVKKAERKGRSAAEVDQIITWLTGYDTAGLRAQAAGGVDFEQFFAQAPAFHPNAVKITGMICGHRVEHIEDEVLRKVRYLDKLIDELAAGRAMEKILRA